jgi:hypothetical protein
MNKDLIHTCGCCGKVPFAEEESERGWPMAHIHCMNCGIKISRPYEGDCTFNWNTLAELLRTQLKRTIWVV